MTALRASVPERFRPRPPAAADASSATSLHFGAQSNRRPMPFGIHAGAVAAVLKKFVVAFHAARMRQAMREIDRYRDLVAEVAPQNSLTLAAAIVGGVGEALVGPLSEPPASARERSELISEIKAFARRAATP